MSRTQAKPRAQSAPRLTDLRNCEARIRPSMDASNRTRRTWAAVLDKRVRTVTGAPGTSRSRTASPPASLTSSQQLSRLFDGRRCSGLTILPFSAADEGAPRPRRPSDCNGGWTALSVAPSPIDRPSHASRRMVRCIGNRRTRWASGNSHDHRFGSPRPFEESEIPLVSPEEEAFKNFDVLSGKCLAPSSSSARGVLGRRTASSPGSLVERSLDSSTNPPGACILQDQIVERHPRLREIVRTSARQCEVRLVVLELEHDQIARSAYLAEFKGPRLRYLRLGRLEVQRELVEQIFSRSSKVVHVARPANNRADKRRAAQPRHVRLHRPVSRCLRSAGAEPAPRRSAAAERVGGDGL